MYKSSYFTKLLLLMLPLSACSGTSAFKVQANSNYVIGPGDVVRIKLRSYPELSENLFVNFSGIVHISGIGKVSAQGLTAADLEIIITSKYSQMMTRPIVHVQVLSRSRQAVYVAGKIRKPGIVRYKQKLTIAESIGLAGGVRNEAKKYSAFVLRKSTNGSWTKFKIKLKKNKSRSKEANGAFMLAPYDIVYVMRAAEREAVDLTYGIGYGTEI